MARFRKPLETDNTPFNNYTIVVPVFGSPSYLKNLNYLLRFKDKVMIVTTVDEKPEMAQFLSELTQMGIRVAKFKVTDREDVKFGLLKQVVTYDLLRREATKLIETKYLVFLDADSMPEDDVGKVCAVMERENLDVASVKVLPDASSNLLEKAQKVEYEISMLARHYMPWLTSGACIVGKTSVLRDIMNKHSLYFWGGDIEIGVLARNMAKRVGHINFKVYTEVPKSLAKWVRQRINWFCGWFRMAIINVDKNIKCPLYIIYSLAELLLCPFKWWALITYPMLLPVVLALYIAVTFLVNWQVRSTSMFIFPIYALFQTLVMPVFGCLRYLQILFAKKIAGRIE
jgi:cellulose synthase/poly-beta-1,6-N-acetylglucosamine synthase-like glycosyltransferase